MNLGYLSKENEQFIQKYKKIGYQTKTELVNEALDLLRRDKEREQREKLLFEEGIKYGKAMPEYIWEALDEEDFN